MYEIIKGVKSPKPVRRASRTKYPFESMEIGDMFFVPGKSRNTLSTHASTVGKHLGRKFRTQLAWMQESLTGWEPCLSNMAGAVLGVAVWREK